MGDYYCKVCGSKMDYYDRAKRIVKTTGGRSGYVYVPRFKCHKCNSVRRALPNYIYPFKHYESEVIDGVIEGLITSDTFGYENYPCEMTMKRWRREKKFLYYDTMIYIHLKEELL